MPIAFSQVRRWVSLKSFACVVAGLVAVYVLGIVLLVVFEDRILYDPTPEVALADRLHRQGRSAANRGRHRHPRPVVPA